MGIVQATKNYFIKGFDFKTRIPRSEFWWPAIGVLVIIIPTFALLATILEIGDAGLLTEILELVLNIYFLILGISAAVRRLHDTDHSGWYLLLLLIPIIGWIWLVVLYVIKGTEGENRFGPDPLAAMQDSPDNLNEKLEKTLKDGVDGTDK